MKYKLEDAEIPRPFARTQLTDGLSSADMEQLLTQLVDEFAGLLPGFREVEAGRRIETVLKAYLKSADEALSTAPMMVTEAAVQEWLSRIGDLETQGRFSEVEQLHDWMTVAFGREADDRPRPLDPRLHRRLGALYTKARQPAEAARQYELARRLAPRDIFVLRSLGQSYMDQKRYGDVSEVMKAIETLDSQAFIRNAENAALKARWYREQENYDKACETLERALERNPKSYYLADVRAQVLLQQGDLPKARSAYEQLRATIERSGEVNVWTRASALTAAVAVGDEPGALALARDLRTQRPTPDQLASIDRGLSTVAERLGAQDLLLRVRAELGRAR